MYTDAGCSADGTYVSSGSAAVVVGASVVAAESTFVEPAGVVGSADTSVGTDEPAGSPASRRGVGAERRPHGEHDTEDEQRGDAEHHHAAHHVRCCG